MMTSTMLKSRQENICPCCFKPLHLIDPKGRKKVEMVAQNTLALLKSTGWQIQINHNIHWYAQLVNGFAVLHIHFYEGRVHYDCTISNTLPPCGSPAKWNKDASYNCFDPNEAVRSAVKAVKRYIEREVEQVTKIRNQIDKLV